MSQKRNLPSWMSSRDSETSPSKSSKKSKDDGDDKQINPSKEQNSRNAPSANSEETRMLPESSSNTTDFYKLMEGVSFVLSGFVNPERHTLRSQALTMGATYQPDWNSDSTLLICAFPNTPKFRQVEKNCGTIVSKEWITQCHTQKKLVDIEEFLMHAGKPWRKNSAPKVGIQEKSEQLSKKPEKPVEKKPETRGTPSTSSSTNRSANNIVKEPFSVTEVKKWARDDLTQTISWLESQEEKPGPGEIKQIAAEGVLTCLQDAIDSLEQKQDVGSVTELWSLVPRVVKELGKLESSSEKESSLASKEELLKQAKSWKKIYEAELAKLSEDKSSGTKNRGTSRVASGYDSDETVEMTEEEIELAYRNVSLESL